MLELQEISAGKWCGCRKERCFVISFIMCVLCVNAFVIKEQMLKKMKKVDFFLIIQVGILEKNLFFSFFVLFLTFVF